MNVNRKVILILSIVFGTIAFACYESDDMFSWSGIFFLFSIVSFYENRVAMKKIKNEEDSSLSFGYSTLRTFFKNNMEQYLSFTNNSITICFIIGCAMFLVALLRMLISI